jgi:hypothetical protein
VSHALYRITAGVSSTISPIRFQLEAPDNLALLAREGRRNKRLEDSVTQREPGLEMHVTTVDSARIESPVHFKVFENPAFSRDRDLKWLLQGRTAIKSKVNPAHPYDLMSQDRGLRLFANMGAPPTWQEIRVVFDVCHQCKHLITAVPSCCTDLHAHKTSATRSLHILKIATVSPLAGGTPINGKTWGLILQAEFTDKPSTESRW